MSFSYTGNMGEHMINEVYNHMAMQSSSTNIMTHYDENAMTRGQLPNGIIVGQNGQPMFSIHQKPFYVSTNTYTNPCNSYGMPTVYGIPTVYGTPMYGIPKTTITHTVYHPKPQPSKTVTINVNHSINTSSSNQTTQTNAHSGKKSYIIEPDAPNFGPFIFHDWKDLPETIQNKMTAIDKFRFESARQNGGNIDVYYTRKSYADFVKHTSNTENTVSYSSLKEFFDINGMNGIVSDFEKQFNKDPVVEPIVKEYRNLNISKEDMIKQLSKIAAKVLLTVSYDIDHDGDKNIDALRNRLNKYSLSVGESYIRLFFDLDEQEKINNEGKTKYDKSYKTVQSYTI